VTELAKPARRPRKAQASLLFDAPGPRARLRYNILTLISTLVLLAIGYAIYARLDEKGQFAGALWSPFTRAETWTAYLLPGLKVTLTGAVIGGVLALSFGVLFGLGRLSEHRTIRAVSTMVVEFFRAIPLLLLIFFIFLVPSKIVDSLGYVAPQITPMTAVVLGLMLYNGSVLAEIFRAGILAVPRGQSEAAYALGLRKGGVMRLILVPQATTAMMPAIVSQLVVLLKDTALGYIISNEDLLNAGFRFIPARYNNTIPAAIVVAAIYIAINLALGYVATWLERRSRRTTRSSAATLGTEVGVLPAPGMGVQEAGTA
jgi:glutamate transport system permease protein